MLRSFRKYRGAGIPLALWIWMAGSAFGLDPNRNLTQYVHRIWQTQPGLRQSTINSVTQTKDGYLWLGTQSGVVRFDGLQFTPVPALEQNSFDDIWAISMAEDAAGQVWLLTLDSKERRAIIVNGNDARLFGKRDGLPSDEVSCLARGQNGDIWLCTSTGLAQIHGSAVRTHDYPEDNRPNAPQTVVCQANDGTVWTAGRGSSLLSWNGSRFSTRSLSSIPATTLIRALNCDENRLWIGTSDGLMLLNGDRETLYSNKDGMPDSVIYSLAKGSNGGLWIGTRKGLSRFRDGEFSNYDYRDGLSQSSVFAIYEDREGSIWVATKNGLNQFADGPTIQYTTRDGLPSNSMGPILEDRDGHIWGGTVDAGLFRFDGRHVLTVNKTNGLPSNNVSAIEADSQGNLWVGTSRGLSKLKEGEVAASYGVAEGLPAERIRSLFLDHTGKLWVGTFQGIAAYSNGRFLQPQGLESLKSNIAAIGETKDGRMLFAAERGGVYVFANGKLDEIGGRASPLRDVDTIYTDPEGFVWMGMYGGGLGLWRNGKITTVVMRNGLSDTQIYGIVPDGADRLWMACSKGFYSVSRAELLAFAEGRAKKVASVPYSPLDRLETIESQPGVQPVAWRGHNGQLWFSTNRGLLAFNPKHRSGVPAPPVAIETITVNGQIMSPNQVARLDPGRKTIVFDYAAFSFLQPEQSTFSYRLEGYDPNWIKAGTRRQAVYSNLPPGNFRFHLIACAADGPCNETGTSLALSIAPAFYQHSWFIGLCIALVVLVGWLLYQARIQKLREQLAIVAGERSRIARELHDTLIQGFSGITMQMQAFASRLRTPEEKHVMEEIIRDAGTCLRQTRQSVAGLRAGAGSDSRLTSALSETARQLTQEKGVRVKLNLDEKPYNLPAEVKYNLLRIAQEAISNSVKHSGARNIEVELKKNAGNVRLSVRDDGRGFARDGDNVTEAGHYGIIGMRERANQVGAGFELASAPGRGTTVTIDVPLEKEQSAPIAQETQETI